MKKLAKKMLCILLCFTVTCCVPIGNAVAMENIDSYDDLLEDFYDAFDNNNMMDATNRMADNMIAADQAGRLATDVAKTTDTVSKAAQAFGYIMTGLQVASCIVSVASGVVSILQTFGVIKSAQDVKYEKILDSLNRIESEVKEINKKVTQIQNTMSSQFTNIDFKLDQNLVAQYEKSWSDFINTGAYHELDELIKSFVSQYNRTAIDWLLDWQDGEDVAPLRALYNNKGCLVLSGSNLSASNGNLPKRPNFGDSSSDDSSIKLFSNSVSFDITLPGEYLTIDDSEEITAKNYADIMKQSILAGVQKAVKDGVISADPSDYEQYSYWKNGALGQSKADYKLTKEDIISRIADDLYNSLLYEITYTNANRKDSNNNTFASKFVIKYQNYCNVVSGSTGTKSPFDLQLNALQLSHAFRGEIKTDVMTYYAFIGTSAIQFGGMAAYLASLDKSVDGTEIEKYSMKLMNYNEAMYKKYYEGNDNYCFPLNSEIIYRDVAARQTIITSNRDKIDWASNWRLVDSADSFDTTDMDVYQKQLDESQLKITNSMVNQDDNARLYYYYLSSGTNDSYMNWLRSNGVANKSIHPTTIVTGNLKIEELKTNGVSLVSYPFCHFKKTTPKYASGNSIGVTDKTLNSWKKRDKLVADTFDISSDSGSGSNTSNVQGRIKSENAIAMRAYGMDTDVSEKPRYLFSNNKDRTKVSQSSTEENNRGDSMTKLPASSTYTVTSTLSYGVLLADFDAKANPYSYDVKIKTKNDMIDFLRSVSYGTTYEGKNIMLVNDIDMSGVSLESYWSNGNYKNEFKGHFDGNNKTIKNLNLSSSEHRVAMFRTTGEGAFIENIVFENLKISNSSSEKNGSASVVGYANGKTYVDNVTVNGVITGYKYAAGIIGEANKSTKVMITNCTNNANITSTNNDAGGMVAYSGEYYIAGCTNNGLITANSGSAGGMSGYLGDRDKDKKSYVKNCVNNGEIIANNRNAGGICGHVDSDNIYSKFYNNKNNAKVTSLAGGSAGGIVGWTAGGGVYNGNANIANIEAKGSDGYRAGGIIGGNQDDAILMKKNTNSGNIVANGLAGGIAGYLGDRDSSPAHSVLNNTNTGSVTSKQSDAGGIVGGMVTDGPIGQLIKVNNNINKGAINASKQAGGIVGYMYGEGEFQNNTSQADVTAGEAAGGIVGRNQDDPVEFKNSNVSGTIKGTKYTGKICGWDGKRGKSINSDTLFGSIFGDGNVVIIIAMASLIFAAGVVIIIIVFKKKKQNANLANE